MRAGGRQEATKAAAVGALRCVRVTGKEGCWAWAWETPPMGCVAAITGTSVTYCTHAGSTVKEGTVNRLQQSDDEA